MRQIEGVEADGRLYRYPGITYQTDCGVLLNFQNDSHKWEGIYPGMSWDDFYNELSWLNIELLTPAVATKRMRYPLFMWPFKNMGTCQRWRCNETTTFKFCSLDCWYFDTLDTIKGAIKSAPTIGDVEANVRFMERVMSKYGSLVKFGSDAESTS